MTEDSPLTDEPGTNGYPVITVSAVDDHPLVLHGLVAMLATVGHVKVTRTARDVDELLSDGHPPDQVVLLDLDLGSGDDAPQNIARLLAVGSAVVVLSATAAPVAVRAAIQAGACGYVPKNQDVGDLITAIDAAAAGGGWVSPQLAWALLTDDAPDRPALSEQETTALRLYAAGLALKTVARKMGVSTETAKQYIDRVRVKYRKLGREAGTKVDLYRRAVEDGHLPG